jgi:hypothetical protein
LDMCSVLPRNEWAPKFRNKAIQLGRQNRSNSNRGGATVSLIPQHDTIEMPDVKAIVSSQANAWIQDRQASRGPDEGRCTALH